MVGNANITVTRYCSGCTSPTLVWKLQPPWTQLYRMRNISSVTLVFKLGSSGAESLALARSQVTVQPGVMIDH